MTDYNVMIYGRKVLVMKALVMSNNNLFCIFEILRALENPGKCLSGTKDALLYITKRQLSVLLVH